MSHPTRAEAPSIPTTVRLSPAERERVEQAARVNRLSLSQFSRDALLDAAEQCLEDPRQPCSSR
jgi:uncharacterized protein (DUF1778 family)